jgi:hypothetical protein
VPLESAATPANVIPWEVYNSRREAERKYGSRPLRDDEEEALRDLTDDERDEYEIIQRCNSMFTDARKAREPYETFDRAWDLYIGNVWPQRMPGWRAKITINRIRAYVTFMQAIMTDNKPRWAIEPRVQGSEKAADLMRKLLDRDWDENDMQQKLSTFVLYGLIWGTAFMKIAYDPYADGGRGKHLAIPVVPYRVYTNGTATCIEDAEYLIHVEDYDIGWVERNFPEKAPIVWRHRGKRMGDRRENPRDFIREGDFNETQRIISAQNVNGNITPPQYAYPVNAQDFDGRTVEIAEYWIKDNTYEKCTIPKYENGVAVFEPELDGDGLPVMEIVGQQMAISEVDGTPYMAPVRKAKQKPVMTTAWRLKYPNGRTVLIAAGCVKLRDSALSYQTDGFPWAMWKDYDVGGFWGQGECLALKDPYIASNRIISQVADILERTGNPSFKVLKTGGVNTKAIKNRPGLIISMDDMAALQPLEKPQMPPQFLELYKILEEGMGVVCGVNASVMGQLPAANTAFATMDQLQESGAAPIRLKVRNLETGLTRAGRLRMQLIQQYDRGDVPIRERIEHPVDIEENENGEPVEPASWVETKFDKYTNEDLQGQIEFGIVPVSSLSTSPQGTWTRWMDLYAKHLIDRRWWHQKFRIEGWRQELPRMELQEKQDAANAALEKAKGKPGPAPSRPKKQARKPSAPPSQIASPEQRAAVR